MAKKNQGTFLIDDSVKEEDRNKISERINGYLNDMKGEVSQREPILNKRLDFYEGRHQRWTNVIGLVNKQQEGHIIAVFNYIRRFCKKLEQSLTNQKIKIKLRGTDESDEIETARAEAVSKAVNRVLDDNFFFELIFKRTTSNQVRDGDFVIDCRVIDDAKDGKKIEITHSEDLRKILVLWDDAAGSSFTGIAFKDMWTTSKIKRDFGYDASPFSEKEPQTESKGSHLKDQFGIFSSSTGSGASNVATGETKLPKAEVIDYWGYEVINGEVKVVNLIYINRDMVQFVVTDYQFIPKLIGHSFITAGRPWSYSFIDDLVDPQVELNDRSGEEGDLIRVGSHMKFLAINMPDFDPDSVKPGSGQVIFIEGENADFKPLTMNFTPFPSEAYLNRVLDHLFTLGIPKIGLSAGTAPYTGRVGAIQYQPIIDITADLQVQWELVLSKLIKMIQQYFIDHFPEMLPLMQEHITDPSTGEQSEGEPIIREIEFDWENVLPLSRSDKVVDASTIRDRGAISLYTYLAEAGFPNPGDEIKRMKKEAKDPELMTLLTKFNQFSPGAVKAQLDERKAAADQAEQMGADQAAASAQGGNGGTPSNPPAPILTPEQNSGSRRGVSAAPGAPNGQTATPKGALDQTVQNNNAQQGA